MKLWIVTTRGEVESLCPDRKFKVIRELLFFYSPELLFVDSISDLSKIGYHDVVIIETKSRKIIAAVERTGARHTGEESFTIECDENKLLLKEVIIPKAIPTPLVYGINNILPSNKTYFVKPLYLEDSLGIDSSSLCTSIEQVIAKSERIKKEFGQESIIEEYIDGYDCTVAIINNGTNLEVAGIRINGNSSDNFLTREAKTADRETYSVEANFDVLRQAIETFKAIGVKKYARIDLRVRNGVAFVIEVNLYAGLGITGYMYKAFQLNFGTKYEEFLEKIISTASNNLHI